MEYSKFLASKPKSEGSITKISRWADASSKLSRSHWDFHRPYIPPGFLKINFRITQRSEYSRCIGRHQSGTSPGNPASCAHQEALGPNRPGRHRSRADLARPEPLPFPSSRVRLHGESHQHARHATSAEAGQGAKRAGRRDSRAQPHAPRSHPSWL